jgi:hypothetical protein
LRSDAFGEAEKRDAASGGSGHLSAASKFRFSGRANQIQPIRLVFECLASGSGYKEQRKVGIRFGLLAASGDHILPLAGNLDAFFRMLMQQSERLRKATSAPFIAATSIKTFDPPDGERQENAGNFGIWWV